MHCAAHQGIPWFRGRALHNAFWTPQITFSDSTFFWKISKSKNTTSLWVDGVGDYFLPFCTSTNSSSNLWHVCPDSKSPQRTGAKFLRHWQGTGLDSGMQRIKLSTCIFMLRGKAKANLFLFILCQQDSRMASDHVLGRKKKKILFLFLKALIFRWWALH